MLGQMNIAARVVLPAALVLGAGSAAVGQCQVSLSNPGFEGSTLSDGGFVYDAPGWTVTGDAGTFNPTLAAFSGGAPEGQNVGFVACCAGGRAPGVLSQTLSETLKSQTLYFLSLRLGSRADVDPALRANDYRVQLMAGEAVLAQAMPTGPDDVPGPGQFATLVVQAQVSDGDPRIGSPLGVRVSQGGQSQVLIDDVSLLAASLCLSVCESPAPGEVCPGGTLHLSVAVSGPHPSFQWRRGNTPLSDDGRITGSKSPLLRISRFSAADVGAYSCTISNECTSMSTAGASMTLKNGDCPCGLADITDASGGGGFDGRLTPSDVVAFFTDFFKGCTLGLAPCNRADITDASGDGDPDGRLTPSDVVGFFGSFFKPCPL